MIAICMPFPIEDDAKIAFYLKTKYFLGNIFP